MQVFILAGGLGTRLRSKISDLPKCLAPINGKPFLEYQFDILKRNGISEAVLCIGYLADKIETYFSNGEKFGMKLFYSEENSPLGTAGAIKNAEKYSDNLNLILNGDSILDINYGNALEFHKKKKSDLTIIASYVENISDYGGMELDNNDKIISFIEKGKPSSGWVNAGLYVCERSLWGLIPEGKNISLEKEIFPKIISEKSCYGYKTEKFFIDIGTPERYKEAERILGSF
jgi:NDP-sugar pyrophosphorylase family protein